jgi:hypothetical protein
MTLVHLQLIQKDYETLFFIASSYFFRLKFSLFIFFLKKKTSIILFKIKEKVKISSVFENDLA